MPRRALFMATGANRGAWYAGLMGPLAEAGIEFELIAACSPSGITELVQTLAEHHRKERLVVITPGVELPAGRWTMDWATLGHTIEIGRRDMSEVIERASATTETVVHGTRADGRRLLLV